MHTSDCLENTEVRKESIEVMKVNTEGMMESIVVMMGNTEGMMENIVVKKVSTVGMMESTGVKMVNTEVTKENTEVMKENTEERKGSTVEKLAMHKPDYLESTVEMKVNIELVNDIVLEMKDCRLDCLQTQKSLVCKKVSIVERKGYTVAMKGSIVVRKDYIWHQAGKLEIVDFPFQSGLEMMAIELENLHILLVKMERSDVGWKHSDLKERNRHHYILEKLSMTADMGRKNHFPEQEKVRLVKTAHHQIQESCFPQMVFPVQMELHHHSL